MGYDDPHAVRAARLHLWVSEMSFGAALATYLFVVVVLTAMVICDAYKVHTRPPREMKWHPYGKYHG